MSNQVKSHNTIPALTNPEQEGPLANYLIFWVHLQMCSKPTFWAKKIRFPKFSDSDFHMENDSFSCLFLSSFLSSPLQNNIQLVGSPSFTYWKSNQG